MKILMVSSFLPYPLYSGGHVRLFNLIKGLSEKNQITLVCEKRDYQTQGDIKQLEKYCDKVITFDRKKQWSMQNILKTGFSTKPFLITGHTLPEMKEKIRELLGSEKFDLIHVETFYVYQNIPETKVPIVLVEHNIEYLVYKKFADTTPLIMRQLLYFDVLKLKKIEEKYWKKADKLVAVSNLEKSIMKEMGKDAAIVPNGVDVEIYKMGNIPEKFQRKEKRILFIGDFKWMENRDSLKLILKEIWPKLKLEIANMELTLWVVGRNIPSDLKKPGDNSVLFDTGVTDTTFAYDNSLLLLAPIRVGGGTSFKILEAMASGVPVITTPVGNEGIGAKKDAEVLIAESPSDFIKGITGLLTDKIGYEKIAKQGRKFIEDNYDWKNIVVKLKNVYQSVI